jgi:large subunit ribosomal protein L21
MYAVIKTGGKQHKVSAGDVIEVERLVAEGETITFQPLLVVDDDGKTHVGKQIAKATVTALPLGEKKGDKVKVFKYRPKSGYARRAGHRQMLTMLEIAEVKLGAPTRAPAARAPAKKEAAPAKKEAAPSKKEAAPSKKDAAPSTDAE